MHKYTGKYDATNTYLLALLDDASVYSDTTNGITVTQLSHATDRATVQRASPLSDWYSVRSWRATSTALAPGKPVRSRMAAANCRTHYR